MNTIKFLDVTLRDGGNRVNFHFNHDDLQQILVPLDNSGIEYIEIGYRNGAIRPVANIGPAGLCAKDYLLFCQSLIRHAKIVVMAHPGNVTVADLAELKACGVALLRLCVLKGQAEKACPIIKLSKEQGLDVSVNFIHMSQYHKQELVDAVAQVSACSPDMIYFADSNGSMLPENIQAIYERYTNQYNIPFGFHAHDNLGLAQTNTLAAINAGARYVDFSLSGMGKGIGNLRTEFFIAYLNAIKNKKYNLECILPAVNYVRQRFSTEQECIDMDEFIRGIYDFSTAAIQDLKNKK